VEVVRGFRLRELGYARLGKEKPPFGTVFLENPGQFGFNNPRGAACTFVYKARGHKARDPCPLSLSFILSSFVYRPAVSLMFSRSGQGKGRGVRSNSFERGVSGDGVTERQSDKVTE
jgi:hypothetical protein